MERGIDGVWSGVLMGMEWGIDGVWSGLLMGMEWGIVLYLNASIGPPVDAV